MNRFSRQRNKTRGKQINGVEARKPGKTRELKGGQGSRKKRVNAYLSTLCLKITRLRIAEAARGRFVGSVSLKSTVKTDYAGPSSRFSSKLTKEYLIADSFHLHVHGSNDDLFLPLWKWIVGEASWNRIIISFAWLHMHGVPRDCRY